MAPASNKTKETEGGDDLGTMDEIRVFKDEGDIDEEDAAESLHADLFEEEDGGSKEGRGGKTDGGSSAFKTPVSLGYSLPSNPYLPGGYPHPHPLHPLGPPPAHLGAPFAAAAAASALRPPPLYPPLPPQYNPYGGLDQLAAWHHQMSLYGGRPPAPFSVPGFAPGGLLPHHLNPSEGHLNPYQLPPKHEDMPGLRPVEDKENITGKRENHIKKPLNAFMLYMREMRPVVQAECTLKESAAINQILGRRWHGLSREEQAKYYEKAREERQKHMALYPNWNARDNYRYGQKKKRKRDKTDDPTANIKKCRARYGLEQQELWCKPCKRKKKCIRVQMYLDGASEQEIDEANFVAPQDGLEGQEESDGEDGSPSSRGGSRMSSERSPNSPLEEMMSLPSMASPGSGYSDDQINLYRPPGSVGPVGADPRDSKNPLSISSLTASFAHREGGGGEVIPGGLW